MSSYLLRDADIRKAGNSRDVGGNAVKFSTFTVANGKVYVSKSTEVDVYGLLPSLSCEQSYKGWPIAQRFLESGLRLIAFDRV
jgi:hypothetical protein